MLTPRALPAGTDTAAVRPTMIGAIFGGSLAKVPKDMAQLVWEARFFSQTVVFVSFGLQVRVDPSPAVIRPLKPKLWLTGKLCLAAHTAALIT